MMKRAKSLLIAASIIALVIGGFQIVGSFFNFRSIPTGETARTGQADTGTGMANAPATGAARSAPDLPKTQALGEAAKPSGMPAAAPGPAGFARVAPPSFSPPMLGAPSNAAKTSKNADVTGSIPKTSAGKPTEPRTSGDSLPASIGGARLRSAALAGDVGAAYEVAVRFADGHGVPANLQEAAQWFARAARLGLAPAQFRYASMLEKGQGVRKDLAEARRFYREAAEQGHGKAMHNLAVLYAEGIDGKPDYASAVKWFRQAALRGVADSQYNLGVLAARGLGTDKNFVESYKWFALAAAQGDQESAKKRDEIASRLGDDALAAARQAVKTFRAEPQPKKAITVPKPQGGWDHVADEPASAPKTEQQAPHAPLSLDSFKVGKR
jgi:localization factor PodJL